MSGSLKVLVVDDEDLARLRLRTLLIDCRDERDDPLAHPCGDAGSVAEALAFLASHKVDVVLLDVNMPGRDGTELAASLKGSPQTPAVVFVTAHPEHALRAFELDAVDYLTKPVRRERLQAALLRARDRGLALEAARLAKAAAAFQAATVWPSLVVNERGRIERISMAEVLYFKAEQKYVTMRTAKREYVMDDSLADLEQQHAAYVLRIHRNALVARHAIRAVERRLDPDAGTNDASDGIEAASEVWGVVLHPTQVWLPVSRRQLSAVREAVARLD